MICNPHDVVVVPFPFIDRGKTKRRPALVLSNRAFNESNHTILAMITTKIEPPWPGDTPIADYEAAGLRLPCIVRLKLFTLDNRLILNRIGHLSATDTDVIKNKLSTHLTYKD